MKINLTTERLLLRPVSEKDYESIFDLQTMEETARYNTSKLPESIHESKTIVNNWIFENQKEKITRFTFAVDLLNNNQFIGLIGINLGKEHYKNAEIWFQFDKAFWNKGYATESVKRILHFGFQELKLHRIEAGCSVADIGSINVLEKSGMTREAHTRQLLPLASGWSDNYGYAILETDFLTH